MIARRLGRLAGALLCLLLPGGATARDACRAVRFEGEGYAVCEVAAGADLRLFHTGADGALLRGFGAVDAHLAREGLRLAFATNGGMYHPDRRPVGLYVEEGAALAPLVTRAGPGNFGMLPNGVLCVRGDRADVIEARAFAADPPACRHATQSGPMLVVDGALHPRFLPDSESLRRRNGVGASPDGRLVHFAISEEPVTFHEMATLFRDGLGVRDALYLDGSVSRLHAPALGRSDPGLPMGPIVVVTER